MSTPQPNWIVLKFGGTSVATREKWNTIAKVVRKRLKEDKKPVVVCSAVSRVSRMLEALLDEALHTNHEALYKQIQERHYELASSLSLDGEALLHDYFEELERLALGVSLTREVSPHLRARVLAMGELMATTLGAAFLNTNGLATQWCDARTLLRSEEQPRMLPRRRYLSATCAADADSALQESMASFNADVLLTQGFIAGNPAGETVLLGWGGSDTSAAYFAAKLQADRLEIWTDVPGMFTANPHQIPSARLLQHLGYDEAQEFASTGAEVLHPRSLDPVRRQSIPLHICCTQAPNIQGTIISNDVPDFGERVMAISARDHITLISMDSAGMWHEVGFLAKAFAAFERHGLSVDLISTSETNVTVSLDTMHNAFAPEVVQALLHDLNAFCQARQIGPCAAVSLVGRNLRSILHELGPALEAFEEQQIYMITQAASDLNFTFVVDEKHAERLVRKLHAQLFDKRGADQLLGASWRELFDESVSAHMQVPAWWHQRRDDLLALTDDTSPLYVYDESILQEAAQRLRNIEAVDRIFYAMKANSHPDILRVFHKEGLGFECVSPGEIEHIQTLFPDLSPERLFYTPNFAPKEDYAFGLDQGAFVTLDNLHPLESWPEVFENRDLLVRIDPGRGHGHHKHVRTAGAQSKFGVVPTELERLKTLADGVGARIIGFHSHVGSGITIPETWTETALFLASLADAFPDSRILNLGGGLGVPERPGTLPLDLATLAEGLAPFKKAHPRFEVWLEPGRYLVAESGVLLAKVTQVKQKGNIHYVGIETGMNSLIRPALYGSYHEIVNLSRLDEPSAITAEIVGPICETGDVLGHSRRLPQTQEGDVLLIATVGAYGRVMASRYNLREPAAETVLRAEQVNV